MEHSLLPLLSRIENINMEKYEMTNSELLDHTKAEAADVAESLVFLFQSGGIIADENKLTYDADGLDYLESLYKKFIETGIQDDDLISIDEIERLIALFLGRTIIERYGGDWVLYSGDEIVSKPQVVRVSSTGKHLDVFIMCKDLHKKKYVFGFQKGQALKQFLLSAERNGFE